MRTRQLAAIFAAVTFACAGTEPKPPLTVTPANTATASGPVLIKAGPGDVAAGVTWSLTGAGTLSDTSGPQTVYRPPQPLSTTPQTATVTASANGQTASVVLTISPPAQAPAVIPGLKGAVSVTYDAQDVPHIFCANALDCFAVQGYIQAQDRLFQMDLFRRTARGQLASLVGPLQISSDKQFLTLFVTRDGQRIEDKLAAALDADTKAKLVAFANGVNAYLAFLLNHPTLMPGEYAQLPQITAPGDIPLWSPEDTLALGRLQQFQLSETLSKESAYGLFASVFGGGKVPDARFRAYVRPQQPLPGYTLSTSDDPPVTPSAPSPQRTAAAAPAATVPDLSPWRNSLAQLNASMEEMHALFGSLRLGDGSNNWVVDGKHSTTGKALVANDPHLSLQYPPLFHLAAMTATDSSGLNLVGGAFPGIPGALIGRGAHVGWGVTVVGYDVTDLYLEQVSPCGASPAGCVSFAGGSVPILPVQYPVKVRGDSKATIVTVLVVPHHGPIVSFDAANGRAISMRWTGHETTADLKAFLNLNTAAAVGDATAASGTAFAALKDYAVGAQNFVLADDAGNIGYDPHALVPRRAWAGTGRGLLPWLPLRGDGSAEWGGTSTGDIHCSVTAPPADCWVPDNQLPQGVNPAKGYYATANSDPAGYTSSPTAPLGSTVNGSWYPYLSFDWDDPTDLRYSRIVTRLKALTAAGKVSVTDMQSVQNDHSVLLAKLMAQWFPAPSTLPAAQQAAYAGALGILTQWGADDYDCPTGLTSANPKSAPDPDPKRARDSAACLLFHTMLQNVLHSIFDDDFAVVLTDTGQSFSGDGGAMIRALLYMLTLPANDPGASFCNDVDPNDNLIPPTHSCADKLVRSLLVAAGTLQAAYGAPSNWIWGRVHTLTTTSAAAPLIAGGYAAGPFARPGGAFTVDVATPDRAQSSLLGFTYSHGSNVRFIAELGDPAAAVTKMQLPGPERDAPYGVFSSTPDLLGQYVQNQSFDFALGHQVDANAISVQGFSAQ
jgi:penicillin amidase